MNLLRSICCLFAGRCAGEELKPTKEAMRGEPSAPLHVTTSFGLANRRQPNLSRLANPELFGWHLSPVA